MSEEKNLKGSDEKEKRHFGVVSMTKKLVTLSTEQPRKSKQEEQFRLPGAVAPQRFWNQLGTSEGYLLSSSHMQGGCHGYIVSGAH